MMKHKHNLTGLILKINRSMVVGASFVAVILLGAFLLMLPITHNSNEWLSFADALFTATSATCVVGLAVVDTGTYFNLLGQLIIIILIQIGGVGVMTLTTMILMGMGRSMSLKEKLLLQETMSVDGPAGVIDLAKRMVLYTFCIEMFFGTLLAVHFYFSANLGLQGVYFGYWHAVSAFCNAGFDLFGGFQSLTAFRGDYFVNICIIILITLGGLGFAVEGDILKKRCWSRLRLHSKVVLSSYCILSLGGALIIWIFESYNPLTLGSLPESQQFLAALFQSVTTRTAGFNTIDISLLNRDTLLFMMFLMFVGGAPASTAGGIKVTTFAVIIMAAVALLRGKKDVVIFRRRISEEIIHKSSGIFILCLLWLGLAFFLILTFDAGKNHFGFIMCELFSAFGTVGLGVGITPHWDTASKLVLIITMFIGRIGILTFIMSFLEKKPSNLKYPMEDMFIG
ncbi:MAG: Trk family potassium uptake protein [Anaerovibrio sp.]|uniref:TrkH family potassium uptake protein n=1 Tax=Anaerovibrio sp. TaxID=1872532 RepID=UPI0025EA0E11|nr:potassium transporter TrkG [Anaerovibrio sp.]MCR5176405.1 Trk family potassium uptake protein [Anaerovibrio sp.]